MTKRIDLFDSTYSHFTEHVLDAIRKETFGQDIGQNSWLTVDEYDLFILGLGLAPEDHILEVASHRLARRRRRLMLHSGFLQAKLFQFLYRVCILGVQLERFLVILDSRFLFAADPEGLSEAVPSVSRYSRT